MFYQPCSAPTFIFGTLDVIKLTEELIEAEKLKIPKQPKEHKNTPRVAIDLSNKVDLISYDKSWQVGDNCLAPWSSDNCSRPGKIVSIEPERGFCTIYFENYDHTETVEISNVRRPPVQVDSGKKVSKARNKAEFEKMKKKKHKKIQDKKSKFEEIEQAHEVDKQKWQSFVSSSKNKYKGLKKSIIENPRIETGKVGIGTNASGAKTIMKRNINPFEQPRK